MSRLVDVDEAIKQLDHNTWQGEILIAILNGLPTAYDVEKVTEQLEDEKLENIEMTCDVIRNCTLNDAIKIVKGGGNDE